MRQEQVAKTGLKGLLWVVVFTLVLVWLYLDRAEAKKRPTWWRPANAPMVEPNEVYEVISCMVKNPEHNT